MNKPLHVAPGAGDTKTALIALADARRDSFHAIIERLGFKNLYAFTKSYGLTHSTIRDWLVGRGTTAMLTDRKYYEIAEKTGVPVHEWKGQQPVTDPDAFIEKFTDILRSATEEERIILEASLQAVLQLRSRDE